MKKGILSMKNGLKKVALLCTALAMNISTFAISTGGAVAAGLGTAAAVSLVAYGASKTRKRHKEERKNKVENSVKPSHSYKQERMESKGSTTRTHKQEVKQDKKQLKENIKTNKKELRKHKVSLKKLQRDNKGSTLEAADHKSMIARLEADIDMLKNRLESL